MRERISLLMLLFGLFVFLVMSDEALALVQGTYSDVNNKFIITVDLGGIVSNISMHETIDAYCSGTGNSGSNISESFDTSILSSIFSTNKTSEFVANGTLPSTNSRYVTSSKTYQIHGTLSYPGNQYYISLDRNLSYSTATLNGAYYSSCSGSISGNITLAHNSLLLNDTTPPTITSFVIPAAYNSLTVPITTLSATETPSYGTIFYMVTESAIAPELTDSHWNTSPPASYTFGLAGNKTLYAWVRDFKGNISVSKATVMSGSINGVCGISNGSALSGIPSVNLCKIGTSSEVTGSGTWNWTCTGSGGGSNANCSASLATPSSSTFKFPQTRQASCWDTIGTMITCTGTGQDGDTRTGLAWPDPRFIVNADQTVTDKLTGLSWSKNANPAGNTKTWQEALDYIKTLNSQNYLGYSNWRLPNINELSSLINGQQSNSEWLNTQGFSSVQADAYWSSDTEMLSSAWVIYMNYNYTVTTSKTDSIYVWPVRNGPDGTLSPFKTGRDVCYDASGNFRNCTGTGEDGELQAGIAWPDPRFTANNDQTVTDNLTGLIWSKDAKTPGPTACYSGTTKTWQEALDYIKCLNTNRWQGKTDWRLPNNNEQSSLVQHGASSLAMLWFFTNNNFLYYWTSTTDAFNTSRARTFSSSGYDGGGYGKTYKSYVWPVRAGESGIVGSLVNGSCGASNAQLFASIPTTGFCTSGTVTTVIGTGPWYWSCSGSNGGTNANCSASIQSYTVTFITGGNGTLTGTTSQSINFGASATNVTAVPATGYRFVNWTEGITIVGTTATMTISNVTATHSYTANFAVDTTVNGNCGSSHGGTSTFAPTTNLCTTGTASNLTGTGPWTWSCGGSNGGINTTCLASKSEGGATLNDGLIAYYAFNGNANDASGNGNNCTVYGATLTTDKFGSANGAYSFNGISDYIRTPPIQRFFSDESVTLSVWFKPDNGGVIINEMGADHSPNSYWYDSQIEILNSGMVSIRVWDLPKVDLGTVTFGTWHHAVLRYSKPELTLDGFLDGRMSASVISGDRAAPFEGSYPLYYGFGSGDPTNMGSGAFFHGSIDEVRIYNRALTSEEITLLYNGQTSAKTDGACSSTNGTTVTTTPTTNLCATGTPSTPTGTGPWYWTCAGTKGGTTASCTAYSGAISTPVATKAKIYLGTDDTFTISNSGTTLYGNTGNNAATIATGTTGVTLDQNIGRINLPDTPGNYKFKQTGNIINVYDTADNLIVSAPVQGDSDGTVLSFSNGIAAASAKLTGGVMKLGGATVNTNSAIIITPVTTTSIATTPTTSSAKVFLGAENNFTVGSSGTTVYGNTGKGIVTISSGISGVILDQNIERINFTGASSSYKFKQTGNLINVYDTADNLIVKVPVQGDIDGTVLGFSDRTASALLSGGVMTLGGKTVSSGTATTLNF